MSSGRIAQHRNYGSIMARHEREIRLKRIVKIFTYFLLIIVFILIFMLVRRIQEPRPTPEPQRTAYTHNNAPDILHYPTKVR